MSDEYDPKSSHSLFTLIGQLPGLFMALLKAELAQLTDQLKRKAVSAGIGIGLFLGAAVLLFFLMEALVIAAVFALALVFPGWLAALLTAAGLLIIAIILALVGMASLKKATPLVSEETKASVREDISAIKGMGKYDN
jgi:putative superfamily III holin-X